MQFFSSSVAYASILQNQIGKLKAYPTTHRTFAPLEYPMNISDCFLVGIGGFAGAICRYGIAELSRFAWVTSFPLGTLIANLLGCFLIGILIGSGKTETNNSLKLSFGVGFLGALTTFSTFGAETIGHAQSGNLGIAGANVAVNVVVGLLAVVIGMAVGQKLFQR